MRLTPAGQDGSDEPFDLGFAEPSVAFESPSQNARLWSELWAQTHLFCPHCGAARIAKFPNNRPVADFHCAACAEEYELKAKNGRIGPKVADGAYGAKMARLASDTSPNLVVMGYDRKAFRVTDLFFVPKQFFVAEIIQARPPLSDTARRAGWIGSNILLGQVPDSGKVWFVRGGEAQPRERVLDQWRATLFLRRANPNARGWLIDVMKCVEDIARPAFTLEDIYAFEPRLAALYPGNHNVRPKIRQQLQVLRDGGYLEFLGGGRYRRRAMA